uniref:AlNc14C65G4617 protein n=1 Tax=Albugo laibachii Nc14 TaxID=890382 RepID=F0WD97_9STRA|nr:AlNc14C65G4617 [Albugo laibachii Nc14]|eukprot:CCA19169.1 AlNc14C65G4617 [Albugo laibachii Nc14]
MRYNSKRFILTRAYKNRAGKNRPSRTKYPDNSRSDLLHRILGLLDADTFYENTADSSWLMDLQYKSLEALENDRWMLQYPMKRLHFNKS